jgi:predicted ABC-class ATPase
MQTLDDLRQTLHRIDGRGYKAYKDIAGAFEHDRGTIFIDHVQGDPFAAPSKLRLRVPMDLAGMPAGLFANRIRRIALQDFLTRRFHALLRGGTGKSGHRGSGKSGLIEVDCGRQEVLERTACLITDRWVELRIQAGLPARGRSVLGRQATALLCVDLPGLAEDALEWAQIPEHDATAFVECIENQEHIRAQLAGRGLVAFVADGAILPRRTGASDAPLSPDEAVPFRAPESLRVEVGLKNPLDGASTLSGMGIPAGVTLIVGGGYHGKSTLLQAVQRGVYPHIPGDGREYVVALPDAVKIRAEDGRRVAGVDISPFIDQLPYGRSTEDFTSEDASGSTSQAANIVEALEVGASLLLLDEDTSATNFMVRDARMQALVHKDHEPITPFVDRVRELHQRLGVSTILVMGGSGDYFDAADTVIMMHDYLPGDVTEEARRIAGAFATHREREAASPLRQPTPRIPLEDSLDPSRGKRDVKIDVKGRDTVIYGRTPIDLRYVEQLVDTSQVRAAGHAVHLAAERFMDGHATLREAVEALDALFDENGLDVLDPFHRPGRHPGNYARPRPQDIAAVLNRLRTVRLRQRK